MIICAAHDHFLLILVTRINRSRIRSIILKIIQYCILKLRVHSGIGPHSFIWIDICGEKMLKEYECGWLVFCPGGRRRIKMKTTTRQLSSSLGWYKTIHLSLHCDNWFVNVITVYIYHFLFNWCWKFNYN